MTDQVNTEEVTPWIPTRSHEPLFIDGRTTTATYLCVAVKDGDDTLSCLGVRYSGTNELKLHFWPNEAYFGISRDTEELANVANWYDSEAGRSRGGYTGATCDPAGLAVILEALAMVETNNVAPTEKALELLADKYPYFAGAQQQWQDDDYTENDGSDDHSDEDVD